MATYNTSLLVIKDEISTIDFISSAIYQYLDGTFEVEQPEISDIRSTSLMYGGRPIKEMQYGTRKLRFSFRILGTTDNDVTTYLNNLQIVLSKLNSKLYIDGGAYRASTAYSTTTVGDQDTGDSGVLVEFRLGKSDTSTSITMEAGTSASTRLLEYRYISRALRGTIKGITDNVSSARTATSNGSAYKFRTYEIELECEPYFSLPSTAIVSGNATDSRISGLDMYSGSIEPYTASRHNRIIIPANLIYGTEPAPTRISTRVIGGWGALMARDVGVSILNAPSAPIFTGSGIDDLFVSGHYLYPDVSNTNGTLSSKCIVEITSINPDVYRYSTNGGSSWTTNNTLTSSVSSKQKTILNSYAGYSISDGITIEFHNHLGHAVGAKWEFYTHQSWIPLSGVTDMYANRAYVYSDDGHFTKQIGITVPKQCKGKYKVYYVFARSNLPSPEMSMKLYYLGYNTVSSQRLYSGGANYEWVAPGLNSNFVDLGVLDFTASGTPALSHPGASAQIELQIYVRTSETITNPSTITSDGIYLIPCGDNNSWIHAAWTDDEDGYETFCNYDMANPYMVETKSPLDSRIFRRSMPLNGSYGGNFITLIPGDINTILMFPIFSTTTDWRQSTIPAGSYCETPRIAHKPRFMVI